eukprot:3767826-Rhodomonas_salina.2
MLALGMRALMTAFFARTAVSEAPKARVKLRAAPLATTALRQFPRCPTSVPARPPHVHAAELTVMGGSTS